MIAQRTACSPDFTTDRGSTLHHACSSAVPRERRDVVAAMRSRSHSLNQTHRDHPRTREKWSARELHIGSPFTMRQHVVDSEMERQCLHHIARCRVSRLNEFLALLKAPSSWPLPYMYLSTSNTANLRRSSSDYTAPDQTACKAGSMGMPANSSSSAPASKNSLLKSSSSSSPISMSSPSSDRASSIR